MFYALSTITVTAGPCWSACQHTAESVCKTKRQIFINSLCSKQQTDCQPAAQLTSASVIWPRGLVRNVEEWLRFDLHKERSPFTSDIIMRYMFWGWPSGLFCFAPPLLGKGPFTCTFKKIESLIIMITEGWRYRYVSWCRSGPSVACWIMSLACYTQTPSLPPTLSNNM